MMETLAGQKPTRFLLGDSSAAIVTEYIPEKHYLKCCDRQKGSQWTNKMT